MASKTGKVKRTCGNCTCRGTWEDTERDYSPSLGREVACCVTLPISATDTEQVYEGTDATDCFYWKKRAI